MKLWRGLRAYLRSHSGAGWNPVRNKKIIPVYGILLLPLLLVGGSAAFFLGATGGPSSSNQTGSINLSKGLVGWWQMNGNAKDSTPNANDGTITGATLTTDRKSKANSAYAFNGASYIDTGNGSSLSTGNNITVSAWFYATSNATYQPVAAKVTSGGTAGWEMADSSGVYRATLRGSLVDVSGGAVSLNQWHLITFTYDGTTLKLYGDGDLKNSGTGSATLNSAVNMWIGKRAINGNFFGTGSIDDVRVYNRSLSAAEVTALYNQYDPGVKAASGENGLVGWWKMDGNAKDASPNANDGSVNGATLTTDRKGANNSAYSFNGTSNYILVNNNSSLNSTGAVTLSVWFKAPSGTGWRKLMGKGPDASEQYSLYIGSSTNKCHTEDQINVGGTVAQHSFEGGADVTDNKWHLCTYTYDGTTQRLYVDGVQVNTAGGAGTIVTNNENLSIGAEKSSTTNQYYFTGSIDDARVYNRALSVTEVTNLYNSYNSQIAVGGSPGSSVQLGKGLVGEWDMNGNAKDTTPYASNGTVVGTPSLDTDRKGRLSSAYLFDGNISYLSIPNASALNFGTGSFTLSAWVKTPATWWTGVVDRAIIDKSNTAAYCTCGANDGYSFAVGYDGRVVALYAPMGAPSLETGTGVLVNSTWYLITVTYDSVAGQGVIYVNGVSRATASVTATSNTNSYAVGIGDSSTTTTRAFIGDIDDARIYNRALNSAEVQALYKEYK